jgi:glucuronate isomerase
MYRRVLARVLADDFVAGRGWSERRAVELGRQVLRGNVERIFGGR